MKNIIYILTILMLFGILPFANAQRPKDKQPPAEDRTKDKEKVKSENQPLRVFAEIERGWQENSADSIMRNVGEKGKVKLSFHQCGPRSGEFSKSQTYYILKDMFRCAVTKKFNFVKYQNTSEGDEYPYAVAEREYKQSDNGAIQNDTVYISLIMEENRWVIAEIKSMQK